MNVDDIVNAFRAQNNMSNWTGPKRRVRDTDGGSETEAENEDQKMELRERKAQAIKMVAMAHTAHSTLSNVLEQSLSERDALELYLKSYVCTTSSSSHDSLVEMIHHVYESSSSSSGQWALLLKHFAFKREYAVAIKNGATRAPLYVSDGRENNEDSIRLRNNSNFELNLSSLVHTAKTGLLNLGFLTQSDSTGDGSQPMSFLQTQDDAGGGDGYDDEDTEEEDGIGGGGGGGGVPAQFHALNTYTGLIDMVLAVLPGRFETAEEYLLAEDHSMFSHAYDYSIDNEGGNAQMPQLRSYFYRNADVQVGGVQMTSPSNRNGDLAAALRSLILMSMRVAGDAQMDDDCQISSQLLMSPEADGRYQAVIDALRGSHALILELENVGGSTDIFARAEALNQYNTRAQHLYDLVSNTELITPTRSPLVDLLINVNSFILKCLGARHAAGLKMSGDVSIYSYPSPLFVINDNDGQNNNNAVAAPDSSQDSTVSDILAVGMPGSDDDQA